MFVNPQLGGQTPISSTMAAAGSAAWHDPVELLTPGGHGSHVVNTGHPEDGFGACPDSPSLSFGERSHQTTLLYFAAVRARKRPSGIIPEGL